MVSDILHLIGSLFLLAGAVLSLVAAIALIRFPDVLSKMHSITKPQVLGILFFATGVFLIIPSWWVFIVCTMIVALQLLTAPVSATMVSRSAYRTGLIKEDIMVMDDLADDLERAGYEARDLPVTKTDPETGDGPSSERLSDGWTGKA